MKIQDGQKGREWGKIGLTITCMLQSRYQNQAKKVKSASCTIHTKMMPEQVINKVKKMFERMNSGVKKNKDK